MYVDIHSCVHDGKADRPPSDWAMQEISRKIQAFAHVEYNTPHLRDTDYITSQLAQVSRPVGR